MGSPMPPVIMAWYTRTKTAKQQKKNLKSHKNKPFQMALVDYDELDGKRVIKHNDRMIVVTL